MSVFADTSGLYAVLDQSDANHSSAGVAWRSLLESRDRIITTNYVLVESTALIQHRLGMAAVRAFHEAIVPVLDIEWVSAADHKRAMDRLLAAGRRKMSLVDCSSFITMGRLGVTQAFGFDSHFVEEGFELYRGV